MRDKNWRQLAMLDSAMQCFLSHGIRGTSMELVAQQAGVAKATLYKYFADKHVLFEAVVAHFFEQVQAEIEPLCTAQGSAAEVITNLLAAKYAAIDALIEPSPHADEFFSAYNSGAVPTITDMEDWMAAKIENILVSHHVKDASYVAKIVMAGVSGLSKTYKSSSDWNSAATFMVGRLIGEF